MIDMFKNLDKAKSYATRANAERKLQQLDGAIPDNATVFTAQRPTDGRWLAILIHRNDLVLNIPYLLHRGVCIVN